MEVRPLHELYQLLWEQIKDKRVILITKVIWKMESNLTISSKESNILGEHLISNMPQGLKTSDNRKAFVLRMIEETKNN